MQHISSKSTIIDTISEDDLINQFKFSTSKLTTLFNKELGIFVWNIQDPLNISKYGDLTDESNIDAAFNNYISAQDWLNGLTQDIIMQYLFLKKNVYPALSFIGENEKDIEFTKEWLLTTEKIIYWLYFFIATNDALINALSSFSDSGDGFGEFWNALIRPKYYEFIDERLAILPDTLALGTKILEIANFLPYLSFYDKYATTLITNIASLWWNNINYYALFDPEFAVCGIDNSYIYCNYGNWIGWNEFSRMARNESFAPINIYNDDFIELQQYLYTSPQIANEYLQYICKQSCGSSIKWNPDACLLYEITNPILITTHNRLVNDYANHITWIDDQVQYIYDPREDEFTWIQLDNYFSGYSYVWSKYLIDGQDSEKDLNHYKYNLPLGIVEMRSFQGAGDIRGLMDIYNVLSHNFVYDSTIQFTEDKAMKILDQILKSARNDGGFIFSPYFGTALDESLFPITLINDAELIRPITLPYGLNHFTATLSVMNFLLNAREDLYQFGSYDNINQNKQFKNLKSRLNNVLESIGNLILNNIDIRTYGIPKQSIVANNLLYDSYDPPYYTAKTIKTTIELTSPNLQLYEIPNWITLLSYENRIGRSNMYDWNYLNCLNELYKITREDKFITPLFEALDLFNKDFVEDSQYQLSIICEGKDPVVRVFFDEDFIETNIELNDLTGIYGNYIPYNYRSEIIPLASAFASETPLKLIELILNLIPIFLEPLIGEIILNKAVLVGFITGIMMTISVVYIKRPKHQ